MQPPVMPCRGPALAPAIWGPREGLKVRATENEKGVREQLEAQASQLGEVAKNRHQSQTDPVRTRGRLKGMPFAQACFFLDIRATAMACLEGPERAPRKITE